MLAVADRAPDLSLDVYVDHHGPDAVVLLGDLEPDWLDVLGRYEDLPVLGVYGNHDDGEYLAAANTRNLHLGCERVGDVTFAGFEGCVRYKRGAPLQYTQAEASRLVGRLEPADVLVSHAPPRGVHEEPDDPVHEGFGALREYIERTRPRLALHGHTPPPPRGSTRIAATEVVHVVGARIVDVPPPQAPPR